jgi:hypothetical protein
MGTEKLIRAIDEELARFTEVRNLLSGASGGVSSPVGKKLRKKRFMSAEARKRIGDAQLRRWAKQKKTAKAAA